jgi:hypothetical protein
MADFPAEEFRLDGDPAAIRSSASDWALFGAEASDAAGRIRSLDTTLFIGPEGDQYRAGLTQSLPPHLDTTGQAYSKVAGALTTFGDALSGLQDRMRPIANRAPGLWEALQAAQGRMATAQAADRTHQQTLNAQARDRQPGQPAPPDTYHSDLGAATTSQQQAWNACLTSARQVKADLQTAIDTCCGTIGQAAGARFKKNPHGLGALWDDVKDFGRSALSTLSGGLRFLGGLAASFGHFLYSGFAHLVNGLASFGNALIHHPGDLALTAGGLLLTLVSAAGEGGGLVLDATGVGAIGGVPLNIVSAAGISAGLTMMAAGAADAAGHAAGDDHVSPLDASSGSDADAAQAAREQRLNDLAKDPAHGGKITPGSMQEARVGLDMEESGKLPGPIERDPTGGAEFRDATGQDWDVKRFNSNFPPNRGGYDLTSSLSKINEAVRTGENVILDTSNMSESAIQELRAAVEARPGLAGKVLWWP